MWNNLKNIDCLNNSKLYGETIFRLSQVVHKTSVVDISDTIVLPSNFFQSYIENRYIDTEIISDCINKLRSINISDDMDIVIALSVYKDCNMNSNTITTKATSVCIKNALTSIYERWFDGKPYSYRIAHKMKKEDTYPSIYIQSFSNSNIFSMITRQPSSGELMSNVESWRLVHCTVPHQSENERKIISEIDSIFALPQKIYLYYENMTQKIFITGLCDYPMTRNAYIDCLIEKHRNKIISDQLFIESINESDVIRFVGYTLSSQHSYRGFSVSPGYAHGKAVFYFSHWEKALGDINGDYVFFAIEHLPEHIEIMKHCKGAIFQRGGLSSHGAVACRGLGVSAIIDSNITFDEENNRILTAFETVNEGDDICISSNEGYWCKNGTFEPTYKLNIVDHPLLYVLETMKRIRNKSDFSSCDIGFQLHFANIIRALKKVGYDI